MDLRSPISSVIRTSHGAVLAALAGTTAAMTAAQVASVVGPESASPRAVRYALAELADDGLVLREQVGRLSTYRLNREHLAAAAIEALADLRRVLLGRIADEIGSWPIKPHRAVLFGSTARGDGDARSDIDLYLERPAAIDTEDEAWNAQRNELVADVRRWTGNDLEILEYGSEEVSDRAWDRDPVLAAIKGEGKVLHGAPVPRVRLARPKRSA